MDQTFDAVQPLAERIDRNERAISDALVQRCLLLAEAWASLAPAQFDTFVEARGLPLSRPTARLAARMGAHPEILRVVLGQTKRDSLEQVWRHEWPAEAKKRPKPPKAAKPPREPREARDPPHLDRAEAMVRAGGTPEAFAAEIGLSVSHARDLMGEARRRIALEARVRAEMGAAPQASSSSSSELPLPDPNLLPEKSRVRFDMALEAHKRRIEKEFAARVYHEAQRQAKEAVGNQLDWFRRRIDEVDRFITAQDSRQGIFTRAQFRQLMMCLHPDNSASPQMRAECLQLLRSKEGVLVKPEPAENAPRLPETWDELMAARRERAAAR